MEETLQLQSVGLSTGAKKMHKKMLENQGCFSLTSSCMHMKKQSKSRKKALEKC